jgi:hypothetical protein
MGGGGGTLPAATHLKMPQLLVIGWGCGIFICPNCFSVHAYYTLFVWKKGPFDLFHGR